MWSRISKYFNPETNQEVDVKETREKGSFTYHNTEYCYDIYNCYSKSYDRMVTNVDMNCQGLERGDIENLILIIQEIVRTTKCEKLNISYYNGANNLSFDSRNGYKDQNGDPHKMFGIESPFVISVGGYVKMNNRN